MRRQFWLAVIVGLLLSGTAAAQTASALEFDHSAADRNETASYTYAVYAKGATTPTVGPLSVAKASTVLVTGDTWRIVFPRLLAGEYFATVVACSTVATVCSGAATSDPFALPPPPVRNVKGKAVIP